jgi:hypothetical protein
MHVSSSLLLLAIATFPIGGRQPDSIAKETYFPYASMGPYELRGQVLDVFGGDKLLLSIGSNQGARKGLKGYLIPTDPNPRTIATVEFVEVGAKHSFLSIKYYAGRFQEKDSVVWFSTGPISFPKGPLPPPQLPRIQGYRYLEPGGAIIDLTSPNGAKLLPPRKQ